MRKDITKKRDDLVVFAEQYREYLSEDLFRYVDYVETSLLNAKWPEKIVTRGRKKNINSQIVDTILEEMFILFCTNDRRYGDVRKQGKAFYKYSTTAIAGYVSGVIGISLGIATGAVSFIMLSILRVGLNTFCKLATEKYKEQK